MRVSVRVARVLLIVVLFPTPFLAAAQTDIPPRLQNRSIVIIDSYHTGFAWSDEELKGVLERLGQACPDVDPLIEYMDAKRRSTRADEARVRDYLERKYRGFRADIVIALDNPALEMLFRYHKELFPGAPVVFAGISDLASLRVPAGARATGVAEVTDLAGTLRLAFRLHPERRRVLLVSDDSSSGRAVQREAESEVREFSAQASFEFLPPSTWEEAVARIAALPPDFLLIILSYTTDRTGRSLSLAESTRLFTSRCPVPAYALHETRLGHGIVGGMLLQGVGHGRKAGDIAVRVLRGEDPSTIPVDMKSTSVPLFDYRQMVKYNVQELLLPQGSQIINRPVTVFSQYPVFSGVMTGLVVLLVGLASLLAASVFRARDAEHGLARSQANLSALIESTDDYICSRDRDGALIAFNSAFARLMREYAGIDAKPGVRYHDFLPAAAREVLRGLAEKMMLDGRASAVQTVEIAQKRRSLELSVYPIRSGTEVIGAVEFARDVTERIRSDQALRESEEKLLQARKMEAVGRLAGGITHDFNNLLTVIKAYADMAVDAQTEGGPVRDELAEIQRAVRRAALLTSQLLAFSRKQVLHPSVFSLNALIGEMTKMLARLIGEDIDLSTALAPSLWPIHADQAQIQQIILNLVLNARDAMPSGGSLTISTENAPASPGGGDAVLLTVSDTGRGMDQETLSHIFEPFFTTKEEGKGTGLGLSIVYGVVQQSGGVITCASRPSRGTTFRITFPRAAAPAAQERAESPVSGPSPGRGTILIAEDEAAVRMFLRTTLHRAGYTVLEARDGAEALETLGASKDSIDLIVSDIVMPRVGGRELSDRARTISPHSKILFISGYAGDDAARGETLKDGIHVLRKPFGPGELLAEVRDILDGA